VELTCYETPSAHTTQYLLAMKHPALTRLSKTYLLCNRVLKTYLLSCIALKTSLSRWDPRSGVKNEQSRLLSFVPLEKL